MKAIIIGGGLGGLSAAIALGRVGIDAFVIEQAERLREVGAGLTFWTDGINAMAALGVADTVIAAGTVVNRFETRTSRGDILGVVPWGQVREKSDGQRPFAFIGEPCWSNWQNP